MPQPAKRERKDVAKIIAERPFAAEDYTSSTLTRSEVEEIKAAFDILDPERVGTIDPAELCSAFSSLGFARQSPFVAQQLQRLKSKKQPIPFKQFLDLATRSLLHTENRQDTQKLFNLFDHEQKGKISAQDLQRVAQSLGDSLTEEQLSKIIAKADSDQDGLLTVDDFYEILSKR